MPRKQVQKAQQTPNMELEVIPEEQKVEPKPQKPKRKCTAKQLAALAAGRAKNPRFHPKKTQNVEQAVEPKTPKEEPKESNEALKEDDASNQCQE